MIGRRARWPWPWLVLSGLGFAVVAVLIAAFGSPPATDTGPGGTAALRRLLSLRGVTVSQGDRPTSARAMFFLPHDLRSREEARWILEWVRRGGRVVVADPGSAVLAAAGIRPGAPVGGLLASQELDADCVLPSVVGVDAVVAAPLDMRLALDRADALGCFHGGEGAFLLERPHGSGRIVALGGLTPLTNQYLDDADDVVLAWNLLGAPGAPVVFGTPLPRDEPDAPRGVWGLLPPQARAVLLQAGLATVLFAVARGRRLGPPVEERVPSPIAATELMAATGELYRRGRRAAHAAALLRDRFRARVGRRLGTGPDAPARDVARAVSAAGAPDEEAVARLLEDDGIGDEAALVEVGRDLERLERRIEGDAGWR